MENHLKWKPMFDFPNHEIAENGLLRHRETKTIRHPQKDRDGYWKHFFSKGESDTRRRNGARKRVTTVHRMVAVAFVPNPNKLECVAHIDGNKDNNHYSNLEWVSMSELGKEACRTGRNKGNRGGKRPVALLDEAGKVVQTFPSGRQCALFLGVTPPAISKVLNGQILTVKGHKVKYLDLPFINAEDGESAEA